jgi:alpha 1,2-mannosyltransferase
VGTIPVVWTTPEDLIKGLPVDVEKQLWAEILWTGCKLETNFEGWKKKTGICDGVKKYWKAPFGAEDPATV